jgi:hypothetical protein
MTVFKNTPLTATRNVAHLTKESNLITSLLGALGASNNNPVATIDTIIKSQQNVRDAFETERLKIINETLRTDMVTRISEDLTSAFRQTAQLNVQQQAARANLAISVSIEQATSVLRRVFEKHHFVTSILKTLNASETFRVSKDLLLAGESKHETETVTIHKDEQLTGFLASAATIAVAVVLAFLLAG